MQDTKSIFSSLTFWGAVLTVLGQFEPKVFTAIGADPNVVAQYITTAVGFAITVYGRWRASTAVTLTGAPK